MKTFRVLVLLSFCSLALAGCAEGLVAAVDLGSAGLTWWAIDHEQNQALDRAFGGAEKMKRDADKRVYVTECAKRDPSTTYGAPITRASGVSEKSVWASEAVIARCGQEYQKLQAILDKTDTSP